MNYKLLLRAVVTTAAGLTIIVAVMWGLIWLVHDSPALVAAILGLTAFCCLVGVIYEQMSE